MAREIPGTSEKALQVNLDRSFYGTIAEIGAGQDVAQWFFHVGGAAGTVAKAISAYDMKFSDAIYGPAGRYVSRKRVREMLDHEYGLVMERLDASRGEKSRFFTFADTVAATSYSRKEEGQGWLGVRFQAEPRAEASSILVHVRLLDRDNLHQQEALGVLGVNLIFGAWQLWQSPEILIESLLDNLNRSRVEIDMIAFFGPAYSQVDNRLMSLHLVETGVSAAAMFDAKGQPVEASELLYGKPVMVGRGSFRPITKTTIEIFRNARALLVQELGVTMDDVMPLAEMSMSNLLVEGSIDKRDFLDRVDVINTLGVPVLITSFGEYYRLAQHLFRYTKKRIGLAVGLPALLEIFDEKYYQNLEGGILESFGRMFRNELRLYAGPMLDQGRIVSLDEFPVADSLKHLFTYLCHNGYLQPIRNFTPEHLAIFPRGVLAKIRAGDPSWTSDVPPEVAAIIQERGLFGLRAQHHG
jgi:hypothetical protein